MRLFLLGFVLLLSVCTGGTLLLPPGREYALTIAVVALTMCGWIGGVVARRLFKVEVDWIGAWVLTGIVLFGITVFTADSVVSQRHCERSARHGWAVKAGGGPAPREYVRLTCDR